MNEISIESGIESRFENSTREELLRYCEEVGVSSVRPTDELSAIKRQLFTALGIADNGEARGNVRPQKLYKSNILPDVNLTPSGKWGGRRRRIKVPRPSSATKNEKAMSVSWNGKAPYWFPFDEPVTVPYPIYEILKAMRIRRTEQVTQDVGNGMKEITTGWKFDDFMMNDLGDDPVTAHLPCSLTEWYQEKGPEFFKELGERDLQMVAGRLDIQTNGRDGKRLPPNEMIDLVLIFLYGVSAESMVASERDTATDEA